MPKTLKLLFGLIGLGGTILTACTSDNSAAEDSGSHASEDAATTSDSGTERGDSGTESDNDSGTTGDGDSGTTEDSTYALRGSVVGLLGTGLVLRNNGGDELKLQKNAAFVFATKLATGEGFDVRVKSQPSGPSQKCTVAGGAGTMRTADVTNVKVSCVTDAFTIGGSLSGLAEGNAVVLSNNESDELSLAANGAFVFATPVEAGQAYLVGVKTQPAAPQQRCSVTRGSGSVEGAAVSDVEVQCANVYRARGTITGLTSDGLVLTNAAGETLAVPQGATSFSFETLLSSAEGLDVSVMTHPPEMACILEKQSGQLGDADGIHFAIRCAPHASYCQVVDGIRWCRDPLQMRSCNTFCSSLGFGNPSLSDTEWLMAQDTLEECGKIATALGVGGVMLYTYGYGCAEIQNDKLMCSTWEGCPPRHRTGSDSTVNAVCPCQ